MEIPLNPPYNSQFILYNEYMKATNSTSTRDTNAVSSFLDTNPAFDKFVLGTVQDGRKNGKLFGGLHTEESLISLAVAGIVTVSLFFVKESNLTDVDFRSIARSRYFAN